MTMDLVFWLRKPLMVELSEMVQKKFVLYFSLVCSLSLVFTFRTALKSY